MRKHGFKQTKMLSALVAMTLASGLASPSTYAAADTAEDLGETVVTAERIPTRRMDTPANMDVITAKDIEANHYASVAEALEHVNGVSVQYMAGGSQAYPLLNGDARVVVLVDGVRQNTDQGALAGRGSADLSLIPSVKNIQRIEVIKGGASALYGSDAVGGVINIITKKGVKNETALDANMGSWHTYNYQLTNQGTDGNVSWYLAGNLQRQGYFTYNFDDSYRAANSDSTGNGLALRVDGKLDDTSGLTLNFAHRSIDAGQQDIFGTTSAPRSAKNSAWGTYKDRMSEVVNNVSLSYNFKKGSKAPGFLRAFSNNKSTDYDSRLSTKLLGIDYQNGWQLGKNNTLIAGLEWHESQSKTDYGSSYDRSLVNRALHLQDTWSQGKLTVVPGLRMDSHSAFGTHWTPKLAVNYRPEAATQLYASWGRVFKAPTADDLYYPDPHMPGNPNLDPESGWTATVGVNHDFTKTSHLSFSLFQSDISDAIRWAAGADGVWRPYNLNRETRKGLELAWNQDLGKAWSYELAYSYLLLDVDKGDGAGSLRDATNRQPNGYRIGLHYHLGPWKANVTGRYATGLEETIYRHSSAGVWDFNVSYDIKPNWTTYFRINNFTDAEYYNYTNSYGNYYPGAGRFFQLGMTVAF